jgi:putative folate metabolism gamma-glutamate ligase
MKITPLKTEKVLPNKQTLWEILDAAITHLDEGSIVAITSKIVAICQGRVIKIGKANKADLVAHEADLFLPATHSKYGIILTIKDNILIPTAGIDESNSNGYYILWPENIQKVANEVRAYLRRRFSIQSVGVVITDSSTTPLRWGTRGISLGYSGFAPLKNYIGTPDIFGEDLKVTKANIQDGLAAAAVLTMGEGQEQTPLALIEDVQFVEFQDADPSEEELSMLAIDPTDDLYAPLLQSAPWLQGSPE